MFWAWCMVGNRPSKAARNGSAYRKKTFRIRLSLPQVIMPYWDPLLATPSSSNTCTRKLKFNVSSAGTDFLLSYITGQLHLHSRPIYTSYRWVSNTRRTLAGNKFVDHSDVVGATSNGAAPTTSSFSTWQLASMDWPKATARRDEKHLSFGFWCILY